MNTLFALSAKENRKCVSQHFFVIEYSSLATCSYNIKLSPDYKVLKISKQFLRENANYFVEHFCRTIKKSSISLRLFCTKLHALMNTNKNKLIAV